MSVLMALADVSYAFLDQIPGRAHLRKFLDRPGGLELVAALFASAVVLGWLDAPLVEDSLFWWVPKGILAAQRGPDLVLAHVLPTAVAAPLTSATTPPQWASGLPDYAHPPLWYWWLGAWIRGFGLSISVIHLACLPMAAAAAAAWVYLARCMGAPLAGLAPLALPPVLAQLVRPELDLPLLAAVSWAVVALVRGRWRWFSALAFVAVWSKEPGVLLVVPACLRVWRNREWRALPHASAPLVALGVWALMHGGLAEAERLPDSVLAWCTVDLPAALRLVFLEQGRIVVLVGVGGAAWVLRHRFRGPWIWVLGFVLTWVLFFSVVGFRLQPHNPAPLTHVRYFVPGLAFLAILGSIRWPWVCLPGLFFLHTSSPYGPESNFYGVDAGRAEAASAGWIRDRVREGRTVWIGSYQMAALTQSWAGHGTDGAEGTRVYSAQTDAMELSQGDIVVFAAYGEPAGRLVRTWTFEGLQEWTAGDATVIAAEVKQLHQR